MPKKKLTQIALEQEVEFEDAMEIAKKKKSKKGTIGMQTDLNIPGSSGTII